MTTNPKVIEGFLKAIGHELATLVRTVETDARAAERAEIMSRLGFVAGSTAGAPRKKAVRPPKSAAPAPHANGVKPPKNGATKPAALTKTPGRFAKKPKGERRTSEDLTAQAAALFGYINAHPGENAEKIARGMEIKTAVLPAPIKLLLREKKIRAEGKARGTRYHAT